MVLKNFKKLSRKVAFCVVFCGALIATSVNQSFAGEQVNFAKKLVGEVMDLMGNTKTPSSVKKQKLVDKYLNVIDFEWNGKMAMGRAYNTLNDDEKKQYIKEYTKFLAYTWLPKLEFPSKKSAIKVNIFGTYKKLNNTDEMVVIELKLADGSKYEINVRVRDKDGKCTLLNVDVVGIDLAMTYRAQFEGIMEQNGGKPQSVIKYLEKQNAKNQKKADFVVNIK